MESTTLYFQEGASDKVYQANLESRAGGWIVNFAYGRRGTTLTTGTKTPHPLPEEEARRICEKLLRAKMAKGYTAGEHATPYSIGTQRLTGIRPQLLNPVDDIGLDCVLHSNTFVMEEKLDGRRLLLRKKGNVLTGINRRGMECGIPAPIASAAQDLLGDFLVDGEAVGEVYHVFDILETDHTDLRPQPYRERINRLANLMPGEKQDAFRWVPREFFDVPKRIRLEQLREQGAEGVVFKCLNAPYTPGRPASGGTQLKYKFVATASVVVSAINSKRSVAIGVWGKNANLVPAGNVTIPPDHPMPSIGAIAEVRYLYAMPESGALFQPVYLGERDDIAPVECSRDQLKFRAVNEAK